LCEEKSNETPSTKFPKFAAEIKGFVEKYTFRVTLDKSQRQGIGVSKLTQSKEKI